MTMGQETIWTCDGCGYQNSGRELPADWKVKTFEDYTREYVLCFRCKGEVARAETSAGLAALEKIRDDKVKDGN